MIVDLADAITDLQAWKTGKATILYGADNTFCSGADLSTAKQITNPEGGYAMATFMHHILTHFYRLPLLTVALVQGKAIGGGAELTTACDFRLFSTDALLGFVHGKMGVVPGWGGGTRLAHLLGYRKALDLITTARIINAEEATSLGLADAVVSKDNAFQDALEWVNKRIAFAPQVLQAMKEIMVNARELSVEDSLIKERRIFAPLWGGPANLEALQKNIKHKY